MGRGWFSVNRELFEHWLWKDKPFNRGCAWIDLLGLANHADTEETIRGKVVKCKRGDVNRSYRFLAERWGWSVGKVQRFISQLETEQMVKQKQNNGETVITIENYNKYQDNNSLDRTQIEHQTEHQIEHRRNTDGTQTEHRRNTNNNVNNINNANNNSIYDDNNNSNNNLDNYIPRDIEDLRERIKNNKTIDDYMRGE